MVDDGIFYLCDEGGRKSFKVGQDGGLMAWHISKYGGKLELAIHMNFAYCGTKNFVQNLQVETFESCCMRCIV